MSKISNDELGAQAYKKVRSMIISKNWSQGKKLYKINLQIVWVLAEPPYDLLCKC